jgi:hypothetical protein
MTKYEVRVYNTTDKFHDIYTVLAVTRNQAIAETKRRLFIETDYDVEEFAILEVEEVE